MNEIIAKIDQEIAKLQAAKAVLLGMQQTEAPATKAQVTEAVAKGVVQGMERAAPVAVEAVAAGVAKAIEDPRASLVKQLEACEQRLRELVETDKTSLKYAKAGWVLGSNLVNPCEQVRIGLPASPALSKNRISVFTS